MADEDLGHLRDLESLLRDPSWHPAAIPMAAKRCIVTRNTRRVRRLRRWRLARMTGKTNQHDRHAGAPVDIHPVYGDDAAADDDPCSAAEADTEAIAGAEPAEADNIVAETQVLSWNINAVIRATGDCVFWYLCFQPSTSRACKRSRAQR